MSDLCVYAKKLNCMECNFLYRKQCLKFVVTHAKFLSKELGEFIYNSKVSSSDKVMWSRDENKAKSCALKKALKKNTPIKRYSLSQVISLALNNEPIESRLVYVDCSTKISGDLEKIKGVLLSFIDNLLLIGSDVVVYVSPIFNMKLDYDKI